MYFTGPQNINQTCVSNRPGVVFSVRRVPSVYLKEWKERIKSNDAIALKDLAGVKGLICLGST